MIGPITIEQRAPQPYAAIRSQIKMSQIGALLPEHWPAVFGWIAQQKQEPVGSPFIRYVEIQMPDSIVVDVGIPTAVELEGDEVVSTGTLAGGEFASTLYTGDYAQLTSANAALLDWGRDNEVAWDCYLEQGHEHWAVRLESYLTDPGSHPDPSTWQTQIAFKLVEN